MEWSSEEGCEGREKDWFFFTDQFVFFDETAELPTRNQLTPLPQDQLNTRQHDY